jgi:zona occludens toxin (predicted ATPase)
MALLLLTGVAGTGKTLYALQKYIIPELRKGGKVYSNIDGLILSRVSYLFDIDIIDLERSYFVLKNPGRFWQEIPQNAMVVIDESQNVFNNRNWQSEDNNGCIKYLMEHRHYGHQVIFVTPHIDALDAGVRRVCEFTYKHKSFSMLGNKKTVKCAVFTNANTNQEPVKMFTWRHDARIYDCYKSYFKDGTLEVKPRVNIFANVKLFLIFGLVLVMIILAVQRLPRMFGRMHKGKAVIVNQMIGKPAVVSPVIEHGDFIMVGDSVVYGKGKYRREIK